MCTDEEDLFLIIYFVHHSITLIRFIDLELEFEPECHVQV